VRYFGNIGVPIELSPKFPAGADIVLLSESAKFDAGIVAKMKRHLAAGKNVMVTSGLLRALQNKGIQDIAEVEDTGRTVSLRALVGGFGSGSGAGLNDPTEGNPAVLFPQIRFFTNDTWPVVRGVATAKGFPIVLMNRYGKGSFHVLVVPENVADLYNLPRGVTTAIKSYLSRDFPVRMDSPALVVLFAHDNVAFVVESFRPDDSVVTVAVVGEHVKLRNALTGEVPQEVTPPAEAKNSRFRDRPAGPTRTHFTIAVPPHSYLVFARE
jgi:hypothetical protein